MVDYCIDYLSGLFGNFITSLTGMELVPGVTLFGIFVGALVVLFLIGTVFKH